MPSIREFGMARIAASVAAVTSIILGAGSTAQAAPTETVTNLNDSGAGSLRQALADVDAGGTVSFDSSVTGTIALQTALVVDKSFTLAGPGAGTVTLDAGQRDNILVIGQAGPGDHAVVVEGLTFYRGLASDNNGEAPTTSQSGGAISFENGASLTVRDSVFRQNIAGADDGFGPTDGGGAIALTRCAGTTALASDADLTVEDSVFRRNSSAVGGGAIAVSTQGALDIDDSEFRTNTTDSGIGGGAIAVRPYIDQVGCVPFENDVVPVTSPVTITGSEFLTNGSNADIDGGAASFGWGAGPVTVTDSYFGYQGTDNDGGAIWHETASPLRIVESLFEGNMNEGNGGAIEMNGDYLGPVFTDQFLLEVTDSSFLNNTVENTGGAIRYSPFYDGEGAVVAEMTVTGTDFIGNTSTGSSGGAAFSFNPGIEFGAGSLKPVLLFEDGLVARNGGYTDGIVTYQPSAEYLTPDVDTQGDVVIRRVAFVENFGTEGTETLELDGTWSDALIEDSSFTGNAAGDSETIVQLDNDTLDFGEAGFFRSTNRLENVTIAGNSSAQSSEGALEVTNSNDLTLVSSTIAQNSMSELSTDTSGSAGLWLETSTTATVVDSVIAENVVGSGNTPATRSPDCGMVTDPDQPTPPELVFEGANLVGILTGCETATGTAPITGDPGFASPDPVGVQRLGTEQETFIVPLAVDSPARGEALGTVPVLDQRGAERPETGADLGAVEYYDSFGLAVTKDGAGTGTVRSNWGEILCGEVCEETFPEGTTVTLTASPDAGSAFTGWSGDCTGTAYSCEVTVDQASTVTASFSPSGGGSANIRVRKAKRGTIAVGPNRTFALARVTCPSGTCSIEGVDRASVRVRGKSFQAKAIFPTGSFAAGQTRFLKVRIPQAAYRRLGREKSGIVSVFSVSVANDSGGDPRVKVFRSLKSALRKR